MAPIVRSDFQERSHEERAFSACSQVSVNTLSKILWVADSTPVVTTTIPNCALCLSNVVMTACGTSQRVKNVHGVARKMMTEFEYFGGTMELKRRTLVQVIATGT